MPTVRQTSFAAGELDPKLWGRSDLPVFAKGLRRCRNLFVAQQGALVSRPGTIYLGETKGDGTTKAVRLVPFIYSEEQTYVLEFGHLYVRMWSSGAPVHNTFMHFDGKTASFYVGQGLLGIVSGATGTIIAQLDQGTYGLLRLANVVGTFIDDEEIVGAGGTGGSAAVNGAQWLTPAEVATPWAETELPYLQFAQSGDVLTVAGKDDLPKELRRLAHDEWDLVTLAVGGLGIPTNAYLSAPLTTTTADRPAREWTYQVTGLWRDAYGTVRESGAFPVTQTSTSATWPGAGVAAVPARLVLYSDAVITVWLPNEGFTAPAGWTRIGKRVYRGRGDVFGWVGDVAADATTYTDDGARPDYALPPPGDAPFNLDAFHAIAYYQERRVLGGAPGLPSRVWLSATGNYFDYSLPPLGALAGGDQALEYEMASRRKETIRSMLGADALFIFTDASVWALDGAQGNPLGPDSYDLRVIEAGGAAYLPPLTLRGSVLYLSASERRVRALSPSRSVVRQWEGANLSLLAAHLFAGPSGTIVDWAFSEEPYGLVWAVRADGKLLSLTPGESAAWAWHDTDGEVQNVCSVPEGGDDAVYLVVKRTVNGTTKRYVERMVDREPEGVDPVCLDCAKGVVFVEGAFTSIGNLAHLEGKSVYVLWSGSAVYGPYTVTSGAVPHNIAPDAATTIYVGLPFTPEGETLDVAQGEARLKQKVVSRVGLEVYASRGLAVGPDLNRLVEWRQRQVTDGYGAISAATELVTITPGAGYSNHGRIAFRQTQPLPLTIVGLSRDLSLGE